MSVNIAVSGKFTKHSVLTDMNRVRRDLEDERRKQRLLEVREESRNLARKIRKDVEEEKQLQLKKLEAIKEQELNCWRHHVMAQKEQDYKSAIFQVGAAHYAAKTENEAIAARKRAASENRRMLQQQKAKQRAFKKTDNRPAKPSARVTKRSARNVCTQTVLHQKTLNLRNKQKKKPKACLAKNVSICNCSSSSGAEQKTEKGCNCTSAEGSSNSSSSTGSDTEDEANSRGSAVNVKTKRTSLQKTPPAISTGSDTEDDEDHLRSSEVNVKTKRVLLQKTPAVLVEVPEDSNDSVIITKGEVKDKHVQSNRQFSHVTRESPDKIRAPAKQKAGSSKPRFTKVSDLIGKKSQRRSPRKELAYPPKHDNTLKSSSPVKSTTSSVRKKSPRKELIAAPSTSKSSSPEKSTTSVRKKSPRKELVAPPPTPKSSSTGKGTTSAKEPSVASTKTLVTASSSNSLNRVQFYDYNNKFHKNYNQPPNSVHAQPIDQADLNAMEQANIEKKFEKAKSHEVDELRKKSVQRGQQALEREQVRRDCIDLTEKLDALSRQQPQLLPTDAHFFASHRFVDKAERKESKMNAVIEDLLMRPAIITCPEVEPQQKARVSNAPKAVRADLNLGESRSADRENVANSSESCSSILMGYIDDQAKPVRSNLKSCEPLSQLGNEIAQHEKEDRLRNLLQRIEQLRVALLRELKADGATTGNGSVHVVIDSIRNSQKDQENDLATNDFRNVKIGKQVEDTESIESIIARKLRELCLLQEDVKRASPNDRQATETKSERKIYQSTKDPLEIIIKVKGDITRDKAVSREMKTKSTQPQMSTVTQDGLATKISKPQDRGRQKSTTALQRQNSYDSNSTAYRSLPEKFSSNAEVGANPSNTDLRATDEVEWGNEEAKESSRKRPNPRLNPLIAAYVQRLLSMSRGSVKALGVSSSDIETPSSSVINTTTNVTASVEDVALTPERLQLVEKFIEENHSFINELQESLKSQGNISLENSRQSFEDIWKQLLLKNKICKKPAQDNKQTAKQRKDAKASKDQTEREKPHAKTVTSAKVTKPKRIAADESKREASSRKDEQFVSVKQKVSQTKDKAVATEQSPQNCDDKMARYAQLTENCTHRIAELTDLINKVRIEKQRLMEVTLTSVSENGRNSTEYQDLPVSGERPADKQSSKLLDSDIGNEPASYAEEVQSETVRKPLEKHKHTGTSRDSGISMSRPLTAQEVHADMEPPSYASSKTQSSKERRENIPPPTLRRFSPTMLEDDVVHELSTIIEVDTPITSRINASATDDTQHRRAPLTFPTFEQYVRELNLDLTQIDPEQSARIQQEFNELLENLKEAQNKDVTNYEEFPSLTGYLQNLTAIESAGDSNSPENIEGLLACLRTANLTIKSFPSRKEYMKRLTSTSQDEEESESLENLTTKARSPSESESETMNIEEELRRRNILKSSFRSAAGKQSAASVRYKKYESSTLRTCGNESGVEKLLSTSDNLSEDLERDLRRLGIKWSATMRKKTKEAEALSSSTSCSPLFKSSEIVHIKTGEHVQPSSSDAELFKNLSRPLNLRDFLTKELLKHASTSCSSSTSDDSLKSHFLRSIIESITPTTTPRSNDAAKNLDRQKTSTPVATQSTQSHSQSEGSTGTSATNLFSGESRLSSVHFQELSSTHYRSKKKNPDVSDTRRPQQP